MNKIGDFPRFLILSPFLASAMCEASEACLGSMSGHHTLILPDVSFSQLLALVAVLYNEVTDNSDKPSEELLSLLACE